MAGIKQIGTSQRTSTKNVQIENQDVWLLKTLDEHLVGTQRPNRVGVFYPSVLGSKCDAHLFLAYNGLLPVEVIPPVTRRIFDTGGSLEERMDSYFNKMGILLERETSLKFDDPPISGRCDFILMHKEDGRIVLELKSANNRTFTNLRLAPKPEHSIQLQIYLNILGLEKGVVLYENKDNQQLKAFKVQQNQAEWNAIINRCFKIMAMTSLPKTCKGSTWCPCRGVER